MKSYIKFLGIIFISIFLFSCSKSCGCCGDSLSSGDRVYDNGYNTGKLENWNDWRCGGCRPFCSNDCVTTFIYVGGCKK